MPTNYNKLLRESLKQDKTNWTHTVAVIAVIGILATIAFLVATYISYNYVINFN